MIYRVKCRVNSRRNKKIETLENVPLRSHVYHPVWRHNKELFVIQGNCVSTVMMAISQTTDDHFANFYFVLKASYWKTENILRNALVESCRRQKKSPVFLSMYRYIFVGIFSYSYRKNCKCWLYCCHGVSAAVNWKQNSFHHVICLRAISTVWRYISWIDRQSKSTFRVCLYKITRTKNQKPLHTNENTIFFKAVAAASSHFVRRLGEISLA